jgi:hypothetical protein
MVEFIEISPIGSTTGGDWIDMGGPDDPRLRVIWSGTCGSTWQRYYNPARCRLRKPADAQIACPQAHPGTSYARTVWGGSVFSRPLRCPRCRQSLELHQPDVELPDRLLGTCFHCRTWALLEVGVEGEINLVELTNPVGSLAIDRSSSA